MTERTEKAIKQVLKYKHKWLAPMISDFLRQVKNAEREMK